MTAPALAASVALLALAACCACYGRAVMLLRSGTRFFLAWYAIAALLVLAAALALTGAWQAVPAPALRAFLAAVAAGAVALAAAACCSLRHFRDRAPGGVAWVVVLGAQLLDDGPSVALRMRLDATADYLRDNPGARCVVSGGQGPNEPTTEARGMAAYLVERRGVDPARIVEEPASTSTVENLRFSASLGAFDPTRDRVAVLTSDFHLFRSLRIARRLGYRRVCGIAAPSTHWYLPNNLLRESMSILKDAALGRL